MNISTYRKKILENISRHDSMLVAFSGGVDSSLLAVLAREVLGEKSRCVLLDSPLVPREAIDEALLIAKKCNLDVEVLPVSVMEDQNFLMNPKDRCAWCKRNSAIVLNKKAKELGFSCIADGINKSDTHEHRPGLAASTEAGIVHPFLEESISKQQIRELAKNEGLSFWNKPSAACLASRIPYGDKITVEALDMIENAEAFLHKSGLRQVRIRAHGKLARIEVPEKDMQDVMNIRSSIIENLRKVGFTYVSLDLDGYRTGSMDEAISNEQKNNV